MAGGYLRNSIAYAPGSSQSTSFSDGMLGAVLVEIMKLRFKTMEFEAPYGV
jgi:hypothetical protein